MHRKRRGRWVRPSRASETVAVYSLCCRGKRWRVQHHRRPFRAQADGQRDARAAPALLVRGRGPHDTSRALLLVARRSWCLVVSKVGRQLTRTYSLEKLFLSNRFLALPSHNKVPAQAHISRDCRSNWPRRIKSDLAVLDLHESHRAHLRSNGGWLLCAHVHTSNGIGDLDRPARYTIVRALER